ncbi:hypothetical protein K491DRAFT_719658 [Lophiostoma macrostomum CBS 122681]|uniref:Uncharacterized protein n=1 Tax=Lophiostoma macrostomum CBS 122681 TaxID=1314788 RepID=A0A6A6SVA7_9PLEO|nr:hypothetical protein K491DRAFT_719658 [Lophiostoma macrostomum CBS 122681]
MNTDGSVDDLLKSIAHDEHSLKELRAWVSSLETATCDCSVCNPHAAETPKTTQTSLPVDPFWIDSPHIRHMHAFLDDAERWGQGKKTFYTKNGVGFARGKAIEGDMVVALDGVDTPFILRKCNPEEEKYVIISSCYLWAPSRLESWVDEQSTGVDGGRRSWHGPEVETKIIEIF